MTKKKSMKNNLITTRGEHVGFVLFVFNAR